MLVSGNSLGKKVFADVVKGLVMRSPQRCCQRQGKRHRAGPVTLEVTSGGVATSRDAWGPATGGGRKDPGSQGSQGSMHLNQDGLQDSGSIGPGSVRLWLLRDAHWTLDSGWGAGQDRPLGSSHGHLTGDLRGFWL